MSEAAMVPAKTTVFEGPVPTPPGPRRQPVPVPATLAGTPVATLAATLATSSTGQLHPASRGYNVPPIMSQ